MSTGGLGMMDAISQRGMEAEVPLSKRIVYKGEEVEESAEGEASEIGMSMTVPAKSICEVGSMHSTQVPVGYYSSMGGFSSR